MLPIVSVAVKLDEGEDEASLLTVQVSAPDVKAVDIMKVVQLAKEIVGRENQR